jgi:hypothetical protein
MSALENVTSGMGKIPLYRPPIQSQRYRSDYSAVRDMAASRQHISWAVVVAVAGPLLTIILALVATIFWGLRGDIDELKKASRDTAKEISETRVELTKAVGAVERQASIANSRLDAILQELRQPRR